jgi:CheY-like chemotaxis protein
MVQRAQNGVEALSIVESITPDVALLDIHMPDMDGLELAQLLRLRAQCALTKLVALTGYIDAARRFQADERVFDCHLINPLSLDDLANFIRST